MKARDLIAMASAHGVDLVQAARLASRIPQKRRITRLERIRLGVQGFCLPPPPTNPCNGKDSHSLHRPEWTIAELGQAAHGVPPIQFQAACFAFAGDLSQYWPLHKALCRKAYSLQHQHQWPSTVIDSHGLQRTYLPHLALMVLDEDQSPAVFKLLDGIMHPIYLGIEPKTWTNQIEDRYRWIQDSWSNWLRNAAGMIQANINGHEIA